MKTNQQQQEEQENRRQQQRQQEHEQNSLKLSLSLSMTGVSLFFSTLDFFAHKEAFFYIFTCMYLFIYVCYFS